jgi:adenylosuccinate lyase
VLLALARRIGRQQAHELVYGLCPERGLPLRQLLLEDPRLHGHLTEAELDALLDPAGDAGLFVDRVVPA